MMSEAAGYISTDGRWLETEGVGGRYPGHILYRRKRTLFLALKPFFGASDPHYVLFQVSEHCTCLSVCLHSRYNKPHHIL